MERVCEKVLKVDIDMTGGDKVDRRVGGGSVVEEESREDFFYNQTGPGMFCVFVRKKRGYFERKESQKTVREFFCFFKWYICVDFYVFLSFLSIFESMVCFFFVCCCFRFVRSVKPI